MTVDITKLSEYQSFFEIIRHYASLFIFNPSMDCSHICSLTGWRTSMRSISNQFWHPRIGLRNRRLLLHLCQRESQLRA